MSKDTNILKLSNGEVITFRDKYKGSHYRFFLSLAPKMYNGDYSVIMEMLPFLVQKAVDNEGKEFKVNLDWYDDLKIEDANTVFNRLSKFAEVFETGAKKKKK